MGWASACQGYSNRGSHFTEIEANTYRFFFVKAHDYCVENSFPRDWKYKLLGNRFSVHPKYLYLCNSIPTAQLMKVSTYLSIVSAINFQFSKHFNLSHELPKWEEWKERASIHTRYI